MTEASPSLRPQRDRVWIVNCFDTNCVECGAALLKGSHILWLPKAPHDENNFCPPCGADIDPHGFPPATYWERRDREFQEKQSSAGHARLEPLAWFAVGLLSVAASGFALNLFFSVSLRIQAWLLTTAIVVLLVRVLRQQSKTHNQIVLVHACVLGANERLEWTQEALLKLLQKGGQLMTQLDDLKTRVQLVAEGQASLEQRIDAIIDALKMPHDSPEVAEMIAQLEAIRSRQDAFTGDLPDTPPVGGGGDTPPE